MNFSEVVLYLPEDLVVRPGASFLVLPEDWVGRCFASQRNRGVSLHPECEFTSWASPASDAQDAQDATNNFC